MEKTYCDRLSPGPEGHGAGVVSIHELNALRALNPSSPIELYSRPPNAALLVDYIYQGNPYMFDYYIASVIRDPGLVVMANLYGAGLTLTMKLLIRWCKSNPHGSSA